jgi:uncharacterized protein YbaP (TraB family)
MKRSLLLLLLVGAACKRESTPPPVSDPAVASPGSAAPSVAPGSAAPTASADPWGAKPAAAVDYLKRPFLWSIEKDGKTSYALGTMHVGIDPERLPKNVWDKVESSKHFVMETNAADGSILNLGARTSGSLRDDLGPDYWAKLEKLIDPQMLAAVNKKKPVIAAVMLSMRGLPMTGGGMDTSLMSRAQTAGKPVIYLEAASKQAALLERWMDAKALKLMIDTSDKSIDLTKQMVAAYIAGDDGKLVSLNEGQKGEALKHGYTEAEFTQQSADMLWDRNAAWIPAIEQMHAKGGGFIAVGALHLVGKKSVLEMLEAKGYKIRRIE